MCHYSEVKSFEECTSFKCDRKSLINDYDCDDYIKSRTTALELSYKPLPI